MPGAHLHHLHHEEEGEGEGDDDEEHGDGRQQQRAHTRTLLAHCKHIPYNYTHTHLDKYLTETNYLHTT